MNLSQSQLNLSTSTKSLGPEEEEQRKLLLDACGFTDDPRILKFNVEPPKISKINLGPNFIGAKTKKKTRRIPIVCDKILDAPGMLDDFYLNLLSWSSSNLLAVALEDTVYIWNANTGQGTDPLTEVDEFCQTTDDYVASLKWAADGSYLAIGTSSGKYYTLIHQAIHKSGTSTHV
jgi:cell division cycle protein 20 (cofactor of APC complex)